MAINAINSMESISSLGLNGRHSFYISSTGVHGCRGVHGKNWVWGLSGSGVPFWMTISSVSVNNDINRLVNGIQHLLKTFAVHQRHFMLPFLLLLLVKGNPIGAFCHYREI